MNTCCNPFSLEGKTILITGASSGIGRSVAIECSKSGAKLILTGRNKDRLVQTSNDLAGDSHKLVSADLSVEEDIDSIVSQIDKVDGVVLSAGIGTTLPLKFYTPQKVKELFEVNFFSQVELVRKLFVKKKFNRNSSVVAISSIGGNYAYNMGNGIYGASKAALSSWCKSAALEFSAKPIRVNSICPGMVHTPLVDDATAFDETQLKEYTDKIALRRFGKPEEIAWCAIYLLSDASSWVTGSEIVIDGGTTLN